MFQGRDLGESSDLDLLGHIPANAARVLALGAAAARLAAPFRLRQPAVRWWAAGPDAAASAEGVDRLVGVGPQDVPSHEAGLEIAREGGVDVVLLDDVVQRLADPRAYLRQVAGLLSPGGTMVVRLT